MFVTKEEFARINEKRKKYMDTVVIDGIEFVKITKEEWKTKGHEALNGNKYIMRYTDKDGTHLKRCIVEGAK